MDGLTAKVFRTYNASITLQQQLKELTSRESASPLSPLVHVCVLHELFENISKI